MTATHESSTSPDDAGELPEGWTSATMGDIANVVGGGTPRTSDPSNFAPEGHAWITPADLGTSRGMYIERGQRDLSDQGLQTSSATLLPPGTVLMSSRAPIGHLAIAVNSVSTNQGCRNFVCAPGAMPEYVYFWLMHSRQDIEQMGSGSTFTEISGSRCKEIPVPLPPVSEQRRIVAKVEELMAGVNAGRERLARVPALLKRLRQSVLAAACSGRLTADWRGEEAGQDDQDMPPTWREATIGEIASKQPRSIQSGPFGSNLLHSEFQESGILAIGIDNVLDGRFSPGSQHRISPEKYRELEKYTARPLDVLLTVMATVGRCCVVPETLETAIITKHVYRISVDQRVASPYYLVWALRSHSVREDIEGQTIGQTRPGINSRILKSITIPLPSLPEQHEIVRRADALFALADAIEGHVAAATARPEQLTQSILAKAFRGELVPTEAELARREGRDYETASVLLERVRRATVA